MKLKQPPLIYSETDYNYLIPIDIAPSLLEDIQGLKTLIVCARAGMLIRLNSCLSENPLYQGQGFTILGIWELEVDKLPKLVQNYQRVVVVGRSRIDDIFTLEIRTLEAACSS